MIKKFEYTNSDGQPAVLTLSDDAILILNFEAEFEEPLQTALKKSELTLPLKLAFAMKVDDGQKVSFNDWFKSLKFPFPEIERLGNLIGETFGIEEDKEDDKEEGEEEKNV